MATFQAVSKLIMMMYSIWFTFKGKKAGKLPTQEGNEQGQIHCLHLVVVLFFMVMVSFVALAKHDIEVLDTLDILCLSVFFTGAGCLFFFFLLTWSAFISFSSTLPEKKIEDMEEW